MFAKIDERRRVSFKSTQNYCSLTFTPNETISILFCFNFLIRNVMYPIIYAVKLALKY